MRRPARLSLVLVTFGLLTMALPAASAGRIDDWARVVRSRHAGATCKVIQHPQGGFDVDC
jgi:hypothetical protein